MESDTVSKLMTAHHGLIIAEGDYVQADRNYRAAEHMIFICRLDGKDVPERYARDVYKYLIDCNRATAALREAVKTYNDARLELIIDIEAAMTFRLEG